MVSSQERGALGKGILSLLYYFVIVMEPLSRMLKTVSMLPDFKYHPMCKSVKLTHLIFAHDLMIFCKGNENSVNRVMEALNHFINVTRLVANMKSLVFLSRD